MRLDQLVGTLESIDFILSKMPNTAIIVYDSNNYFHFLTGPALEHSGYPKKLFYQKTLQEAFSEEDVAVLKPLYDRVLSGEEFTLDFRGTNHVDYKVHLHPVIDGDHVAGGVNLIVQASTQESEMLQQIVRSSPDGIQLFGPEGNILWANPTALQTSGFGLEEIQQKKVHELQPIFASESAWKEYFNTLAQVGSDTIESTHVHSDGTKISMEVTYSYILFNNQGCALAVSRDISKLKESETKYRTIVETAQEGVWVVDSAGKTTFSNQRMADMLGYTVEEMLGRSFYDFMDSEGRQIAERNLARRNSGITEQHDFRFRRRDGTSIWTMISTNPLFDADGAVIGALGMVTDITDRTRLEQQLRRAQKLEAVGELAGGIAHEFNNLLQMIMGFNALAMEQTPRNDNRHKNLVKVHEVSIRGAALVKQLLGFSRRQTLNPSPVDVNDLISSLSKMVRATLGDHVQLDLDLDATVKPIHADSGAIEQILMNLLINGRDAMPSGGRMALRTKNVQFDSEFCVSHPWAKSGNFVCIALSDAGEGMSKEVLEQIFQPFFTTKGPQKGTGLGLSMVFGLVEQHNGLINVQSKLGTGSTFELYFPAENGRLPMSAAEQAAMDPISKGKGQVLVAEDEVGVHELTTNTLESAGFTVLSARDGEMAIQIHKTHATEIDLILLDVVMPKIGGIEAYRQIRAKNPSVPVIFQTGYELGKTDVDYLKQEGVKVLQKPYSPSELMQIVIELLGVNN